MTTPRPLAPRTPVAVARLQTLGFALLAAFSSSLWLPAWGPLPAHGGLELTAQVAGRPEVRSLDFEGNGSFSRGELAAAIVTRQTECRSILLRPFCWAGADFAQDRRYLNTRTLADDYVRVHLFYRQRGFRDVQVDTVLSPSSDESVDVLFRVEEGEPHRITALDIFGIEGVDGSPLETSLPIAEGDPLDLVALDVVRDTLTRRLQNRGYAHADVLRNVFIPAGEREAEVDFDVYTGPLSRFGPIEVVGNQEVEDRVVLRMLPFGEGGLYRRELLFDAQRTIYSLEIFLNASISEDLENQPDSIVPLRVQVNEGNSHRVRAGGGWNTEECLTAETSWASRNYFGGARQLVLRGRASNLLTSPLEHSVCSAAGSGVYGEVDWVLSADFTQPFLFTSRNSFTASVYAERQSLQNVFVREALGLNLGLTRSVGRSTPLTLSYRPQLARLDAAEVFFCTSFLVCDPLDIDLLQASNVVSPIGLSLIRDRTNGVISPTAGYRGLIDLESAADWTGSDFTYERAIAEIVGYHRVQGDVVIAGRLRGGWLKAHTFEGLSGPGEIDRRIAHPEKRFYAGGSNSVRGYAQNQLGPQVVSVAVDQLLLPQSPGAEPVCLPEEITDLSCSAAGLAETVFFARPTGGTRLVEGNLELRFPIWGATVGGAAFVDFGRVWDTTTADDLDKLVFTPGVGIRYRTPIGPVRIDLGYRGNPVRRVPVITSQVRPFDPGRGDEPGDRIGAGGPEDQVLDWVLLEDLALLEPRVRFVSGTEATWWRGLQLHFSIGQAF